MPQPQMSILEFEPIDRAWLRLECREDGWYLHIAHAHRCGKPGDCDSEQYAALTLSEVMDVLDATLLTLGHSQ